MRMPTLVFASLACLATATIPAAATPLASGAGSAQAIAAETNPVTPVRYVCRYVRHCNWRGCWVRRQCHWRRHHWHHRHHHRHHHHHHR